MTQQTPWLSGSPGASQWHIHWRDLRSPDGIPLPSAGEVCEYHGFRFQVIIQGNDWYYDGYDPKIRDWMDEHLTDKFTFYTRFDPDPRGGAVPLRSACVRFRDENDAIAFKMRWV